MSAAHHHPRPHLQLLFPAIAAIVLDLFNREGFDVVHEPILPNYNACHRAVCALPAQALSARNIV